VAKSEYEWEIGSPPPTIKLHSLVKHEIINAYIAKYVGILAANPAQRQLRLTLIDGFAGGGLYLREDNGREHEGSPLVLTISSSK
jgi:three-Cys-motif partner protein